MLYDAIVILLQSERCLAGTLADILHDHFFDLEESQLQSENFFSWYNGSYGLAVPSLLALPHVTIRRCVLQTTTVRDVEMVPYGICTV